MKDTLIKLADLYYLCNDNLKRNSHTIHCLLAATEFLNGKFTGDPKNLTVGGHYFRKLVDELLTRTNNKLIKKFPFRFNDLFQAMNKFIELYELRKTEFEAIDYETLRSNFPKFETLYLFNYYEFVFLHTNSVFNNFEKAEIKIKSEAKPKINELKTDYSTEQLNNLFDGLNKEKKRIDIKRKTDFIKLFHDANLVDWKRIKWEGSNPELATLIYKLTGKTPEPLIVNRYFEPKSKYDTNSHSGERKGNHAITIIYNKSIA